MLIGSSQYDLLLFLDSGSYSQSGGQQRYVWGFLLLAIKAAK